MSEAEEMYLISAARLIEDGQEEPVPLSALAQARSHNLASVNQMVRKLADVGLVNYLPYKGIEFTPQGRATAMRILRYRRLWEVFLVERLGLSVAEADALACRLEHLTSENVSDRLCNYLGGPTQSPQGKPIPSRHESPPSADWIAINQLPVGLKARVDHVECEPVTRAFLEGEGIRPGAIAAVMAVGGDGGVLVDLKGRTVHLSAGVAERVLASPVEEPR